MRKQEEYLYRNRLQEVKGIEQVLLIENLYENYFKEDVNYVIEKSESVRVVDLLEAVHSKGELCFKVKGTWVQVIENKTIILDEVISEVISRNIVEEFGESLIFGYKGLYQKTRDEIKEKFPLKKAIVQYVQGKIDEDVICTPTDYEALYLLLPDIEEDVYEELRGKEKGEMSNIGDMWLTNIKCLQKRK